jgi:hypothetical protein
MTPSVIKLFILPVSDNVLFKPILTYSLTPWNRVLLEKLTGSQLVTRHSPRLMEPEGSFPRLQQPSTSLYPRYAIFARVGVLTSMLLKVCIFWNVTPCSLVHSTDVLKEVALIIRAG